MNIVGDSIDLEMRIVEGQQAHLSKVRINGNDRLYENVVRRELRTKPGDLFSKEALQRSARELASMVISTPRRLIQTFAPTTKMVPWTSIGTLSRRATTKLSSH